jgi:hypothetical protein
MSRSASQVALATLEHHLGKPCHRGMLPERSRARLVPGKGVLLSVHEDPGVAGDIVSAAQQGPR